jgi:drug/metabolite transporter (DMT)-like permease
LENRLNLRVFAYLALFLCLRGVGNLSLAWGTKRVPQNLATHPLAYISSMADPFVAAGIVMLIIAMLTRIALLSVADLSVVLPLTAVGYVISAVLGRVVLHEQVDWQRWVAVLLIFGGAALAGSTARAAAR